MTKQGARTVRFQVMVNDGEKEMVLILAKLTGDSQAKVFRDGMYAYYAMKVQGRATCSDGRNCACPQFHNLEAIDQERLDKIKEQIYGVKIPITTPQKGAKK